MNDYQPISPKDIEKGYFILTHRDQIRKILIGLAIFFNAIIYIYIIFNLWTFINEGTFSSMASRIDQSYNWTAYHAARQPQAIKNSPPQFFSLGSRRYNLISVVENPNSDWAAVELDYTFIVNGQEIGIQKAFLNPGEKRLVVRMGHEAASGISRIDINISNVKWHRIENDLPEINFEIRDVKFQPLSRETVDGKTFEVPARVSWYAKNWSLFNFWEVDWQVVLLSGGNIVAINELKTLDFLSLESRELEVAWLSELPRVSTVEVYPILNKLNSDNFKNLYIDPQSGSIYDL